MPASSQAARQVTSIVVPGAASAVAISHETVPFREEIFSATQLQTPTMVAAALQQVQRHVAEATQAPRSLPVLGGTYFPNVTLLANTAITLAHRIAGQLAVSFLVCRPSAAASVYEVSQNTNAGLITLKSTASVVVDLWFFPVPSAGQASVARKAFVVPPPTPSGLILSGPSTARPTATGSGDIYFCDDVSLFYIDDPTLVAWKQYSFGGYVPRLSPVASWTAYGQPMGLTQVGDSILATSSAVSGGAGAGGVISAVLQPIPGGVTAAGPWKVTLAGEILNESQLNGVAGVCVTDGTTLSTSKVLYFGRYANNGSSPPLYGNIEAVTLLNTATRTQVNTAGNNGLDGVLGAGTLRYRLVNDGTYIIAQYSNDGYFWRNYGVAVLKTTIGLATFAQFGFALGNDIGGVNQYQAALVQECGMAAYTPIAITGVTVGASEATVTTATPHGMQTGYSCLISGIVGTGGTPPAGSFDSVVVVTGANTFEVPGTAFTYVSGGIVTPLSLS